MLGEGVSEGAERLPNSKRIEDLLRRAFRPGEGGVSISAVSEDDGKANTGKPRKDLRLATDVVVVYAEGDDGALMVGRTSDDSSMGIGPLI